ncbi:MAG: hypothetical protein KAT79_05505 [candidate division Zixibacteria bacterium]|nr:hypothetical protein [candidate division Zixibacteria bacterium]
MKKLLPALLTLALVLLLATSVMSAPRLTIPEASFNFGYCPQNSKITHDFWLMSTGDDSLKILKVLPG